MAGKDVTLVGRNADSLGRARQKIADSLAAFVKHGLLARDAVAGILGRVRTSRRAQRCRARRNWLSKRSPRTWRSSVIFSAELDQDMSRRRRCSPHRAASRRAHSLQGVKHRERVIATHFWYPPQLIPLVEVCGGPETAPEVVTWVCEALRAAGKEPAVIDKEIPGFIGNRLQFAMLREAWALWASGAASAAAINSVVRHSFGRRVAITGPLESADVGGLQTMYHFARSLLPDLDTGAEPATKVAELAAPRRQWSGKWAWRL